MIKNIPVNLTFKSDVFYENRLLLHIKFNIVLQTAAFMIELSQRVVSISVYCRTKTEKNKHKYHI